MPAKGGKTALVITILVVILGGSFAWGFSKRTSKNLPICEVQGSGDISPYAGNLVFIQGVVTADSEEEIPAGFFIFDQNCPAGKKGSMGIFVQHDFLGDIVHLGDEVQVKGLVQEFSGETRLVSDPAEIEILSLGNELSPSVNLERIFSLEPVTFQYENWEGRVVSIPKGELLPGIYEWDLPRLLPFFDLPPDLQLICLQGQSLTLQLSNLDKYPWMRNISDEDIFQNLTGVIRQNINGYILDLTPGIKISMIGRQELTNSFPVISSLDTKSTGMVEVNTPDSTSGTPVDSPTSTLIPPAILIPSPTWYPVHLLISEFYPNPTSKEPDGEWLEIYNPETYGQPLTGIKVGDETSPGGNEGMLKFPDGYYIGAKEVMVIANRANVFLSENGFLPDFEFEDSDNRVPDLLPYDGWGRSGIQFSNSGDEVLLLDPWDEIVDQLVYGNSTEGAFSEPPPSPDEGNSLERYPPERDRDRGGDWREREQISPGRLDRSPPTQPASLTPGAAETPTASLQPSVTMTAIVIPSSSPTIDGSDTPTPEVVFSPTLSQTPPITLTPISTSIPTITLTSTLTLTPSEPAITPPDLDPSSTPTAAWTLVTATQSMTPQPATPSTTPSLTSSPGPSLTPVDTSTVVALETIIPSPVLTITNTPVYLEDLDIVLNEIHADPDLVLGDANNDGSVHSDDDEFLEFVNISQGSLDLSGWMVSDAIRTRFTFPEGSILKEGCGVVIFGGGAPGGNYGGSLVFIAGSLGLNNSGDTITLQDAEGLKRLRYQFGEEGGKNQSLTRSPDISAELPLVPHSEVPESLGTLFSPGVKLDNTVFNECP